jgi:signal transduction histidine kinase
VDIVMVLAAVAFGAALSLQRLDDPSVPDWLLTLDQVAGGLGCAALWLRRRWPVGIALGLVPLSTFSELVAGAQIVALFTVAVHRPVRVTVAVSGLSLLSAPVYVVLRPEPGIPGILVILLGLLVTLAVVGWGLFVRHRRQLILSLRERAARAETEARLRAEQAQHLAREEIAREMHDVLGHRLSLLSVHAGALEYRRDASAEEVARAAGVIRESAHQALQDLREVIGVLRAPMGELPQPTLADVRELVADSVRAGMRVELRMRVTGEAPASVGRTAYRIVQEGLTNVRRHAPGAQVCVTVHGAPGEGLTVEVRDSGMARETAGGPESGAGRDGGARDGGAKDGSRAVVGSGLAVRGTGGGTGPCDGHGLIGLAERASLAGGRLEHGPVAGGGFVLSAWLPWPA